MIDVQELIIRGRIAEAVSAAGTLDVPHVFDALDHDAAESHAEMHHQFLTRIYGETADPFRKAQIARGAASLYATSLVLVPGATQAACAMLTDSMDRVLHELTRNVETHLDVYASHPDWPLPPETFERAQRQAASLKLMRFAPTDDEIDAHTRRVADHLKTVTEEAAAAVRRHDDGEES